MSTPRNFAHWVPWRWEIKKDGKRTKVPFDTQGYRMSWTDTKSWTGLAQAAQRKGDGVGYVVWGKGEEADPFTVFDLDHCRDPDDRIADWAMKIVRRFDSYTELTPGDGLRIWIEGKKPGPRCSRKRDYPDIEVYDHNRFVTVTFRKLEGTSDAILNRQAELDAFYHELFPEPQISANGNGHRTPTATMADFEVLSLAQRAKNGAKVQGLLRGDAREYPSHSEADAALLSCLAFYTQDSAQLDRLWLGSGLTREHTKDAGYRARTIAFAVTNTTETYQQSEGGEIRHSDRNDELRQLVGQNGNGDRAKQPAPTRAPRSTLADIEAIWTAWMATGKDDKADPYPLHVVLGVYAANRLEGEPVWAMIVGSSGGGKTEVVRAIEGSEHVAFVSDLSGPPALLSGTPKKNRTNAANGGLLRMLGDFGVLALKDFTTILEMHREKRAEILAALREIHDGAWYRDIGTDGGTRLSWQGKLGLVAGCTTAIDANHGVMAEMGPRFLLARLPEVDRKAQGCRAVRQSSHEKAEREKLRLTVRGLFENLGDEPPELDDATVERIVDIADLVALARSPVQRDYRGDLELVHDPEAPTRISKQLAQLYRGLLWIGLDDRDAWQTVARVAADSIPKLRGLVFRCLAEQKEPISTSRVAGLVDHPTQSTRRALEELDAHNVAERLGDEGNGRTHTWVLTTDALNAWRKTFPEKSASTGNGSEEEGEENANQVPFSTPPDKSGTVSDASDLWSDVPRAT